MALEEYEWKLADNYNVIVPLTASMNERCYLVSRLIEDPICWSLRRRFHLCRGKVLDVIR